MLSPRAVQFTTMMRPSISWPKAEEPLLGRVWIVEGDRQRILKDGDRIREFHPVLAEIGAGLRRIPLIPHESNVCTTVYTVKCGALIEECWEATKPIGAGLHNARA